MKQTGPRSPSPVTPSARRSLHPGVIAQLAYLIALCLGLAACGGTAAHEAVKPASSPLITLATPTQRGKTVPPPSSAAAPASSPAATTAPQPAGALPIEPLQMCLVTRDRGVPASYVPPDLALLPEGPHVRAGVQMRREPAQALLALLQAAEIEGQQLIAISGYRSYEEQQALLDQEMKTFGPAQAQRQVAPPGHSEHQVGVAVDVLSERDPNDLTSSFGDSTEGRWLAVNSPRFGFVISYPADKEAITGYIYEPWHIRYVGFPWAQQITASGLTITEFLAQHGMAGC
jgi:zinc D-Ala-D-Ala carboxypeptidase